MIKTILLALLGCVIFSTTSALAGRPNVVLVMVDDFGYECVGANGSTSYRTPHLDALAAGGMRFENCYVQPLCTPTRVQLMTGQYNVRNYTRFGHLDPRQTTFGQVFKQAGYATCIAGKWQLGRDMSLPRHFGFEKFCLWQLDRRPPRYANPGLEIDGHQVDYTGGEYGPDIVSKYALDFMAQKHEQPFFLYYPMMLTHDPFQPTPDSPDWDPQATGEQVNRAERHFGEMVSYADKLIGQLVATLEEHRLRDNTLLIVFGDNGTKNGVPSKMGQRTVRGGKGTATETGMHVPLIVSWPGTVSAGRVSSDLVDSTDFFPTICEAASISPPAKLDGHSFAPQLRGKPGTPREWIYCWYAREGGAQADREFAMTKRYKLDRGGAFFELATDGQERPLDTGNLAAEATAAHQRLAQALDQYKDARPAALASQAGPKRPAQGGQTD